jgi:thiol-disulfide isomerase/thioredoxin
VSKANADARGKSASWWNPGWSWKVWGVIALMLLPTIGFAIWVLAEAGGQTTIDPATLTLARENADGDLGAITAITGTEHTVYHANDPLPEAKAPRKDGRPTLVWFTTTGCAKCEDEMFVHAAVKEVKQERDFVFMEKELSREPAAGRLGVSDVPTFVWLDPEGKELGRFSDVADKAQLAAEIERIAGGQ